MTKILILTDYRNSFYSRMGSQENGFNLSEVTKYFADENYSVEIKQFTEIDFYNDDLSGIPILYTSLEDPGLHYKSFIEDIILGLEMAGACLIPPFYYLRAHHNKVFLEILRQNSKLDIIHNLKGSYYGVPTECTIHASSITYPVVVKPAAGANSRGVTLVKNQIHLTKSINNISNTNPSFLNRIYYLLKPYARYIKKLLFPNSFFTKIISNREKFVTQQFIDNLLCDYKILVYGTHYYVLQRDNRPNDFRASGSGLFSWPNNIQSDLLDYAKVIFDYFNVPYMSLDIAHDGSSFYLIEFQFIMFGTFTLEKSSFFYTKESGAWSKVYQSTEIEKEFVWSVTNYLNKN